MKYCQKCGREIMDEAVICPGCGCPTNGNGVHNQADSSSIGWALLGYFIPIVGLILYLTWKDSMPLKAKSAGKGALISVCVSVILSIIITAVSFSIGFMVW